MSIDTQKAKRSWQQLSLEVSEDASCLAQQILWEMGALGLEIDDDETRAIPEKPFTPTHVAHIVATFDTPHAQEKVNRKLSTFLEKYRATWQELIDGDWVDAFHRSWKSFTLGHNIWIVPSWEADQFQASGPEPIILQIDPGMAFGTGHHETTTLCARAIYECVKANKQLQSMRVLDVGTGTGILAMIAAKMGVKHVVGTDNDPEAIRVAIENCANNCLSDKIEIFDKPPHFLGPVFDLVVANILANPLIEMSEQIVKSMHSKGTLLLSGILQNQESAVCEAYAKQGLIHQKTTTLNEWVLILFHKP